MKIRLTRKQMKALRPLLAMVSEAFVTGNRGSLMAQIHDDGDMNAVFFTGEKVTAIQQALAKLEANLEEKT